MNYLGKALVILLVAGSFIPVPRVDAAIIDFETLADSVSVTTQFAGLTFTNTVSLTAGISLNEFEFPPHSGANVVFDNGGRLDISFDAPQGSVGGFITYLTPVTLTAFGATGDVLGSVTSAFSSNLALSGDAGSSPNEFLGLAFPTGIARVVIQGDAAGSSFTLDDLTFQSTPVAVPEPSSFALTAAGPVMTAAFVWRSSRRRPQKNKIET